MHCYVYRSSVKDGLYVYLIDEDGLDTLPAPVLKQLGKPELAMSLDLATRASLGHEDIAVVRKNLETQGFHIQMPKSIEHLMEQAAREARKRIE